MDAPVTVTFPLGPMRVHVVEEATFTAPSAQFFVGASADQLATAGIRDTVDLSFNPLVVESGDDVVLVDAGVGQQEDGRSGLLDAIEALGLAREAVTTVVLTHAHTDHIAGLVDADGAWVFERARVHLSRPEWAYWHAACEAGEELPHTVDFARTALAFPDRVVLHDGEATIRPGVTLIPAPGHTPGHCAVLIGAGQTALLATGDAFSHPLHIEHPEWRFERDVSPERVAGTRASLLARAHRERASLAGYHFPFPGVVDPGDPSATTAPTAPKG